MTPVHTFNEAKKRFEPTEKQCQFCGANHNKHMEDNYFVPLFKEQDRTNVIVYRSVKYSKIPIGIPRCEQCQEIHDKSSMHARLYATAIAIAAMIFSIYMWGIFAFFAIVPCLFIGIFGSTFIENKLVEKKGIFTKMEGAKQNETVQDLVIHGWSFTQPSA